MPRLTRTVLRSFFERGDIPTENQFGSFIDSSLNLIEDKRFLGLKAYDPTFAYDVGDTTIYTELIYQAIAPTTGTFDPIKWQQLTFGGVRELTYAELSTLKSSNNLRKGQMYFISDRNIWIQALSTNVLSVSAHLKVFNADYQNNGGNNVGVWNDALTGLVANTSISIWDALHWRNLTGDVGTQPNGDMINWELITPADDPTYVMEIDVIKFNFDLGLIYERSDKRGNFISIGGVLGSTPMEFFQWGRDGVQRNIVRSELLNNINSLTVVGDRRMEAGFSNYEVTMPYSGSTLALSGFGNEGIIFIDGGGGGSGTFNTCTDAPDRHPFTIMPINGFLLTINNGTFNPGEFALNSGGGVTLDGTKGDYAKFQKDSNGVMKLVEIMSYF